MGFVLLGLASSPSFFTQEELVLPSFPSGLDVCTIERKGPSMLRAAEEEDHRVG